MLISVQQKGLLAADDSVNEEGDASKIKELFPPSEKKKKKDFCCRLLQYPEVQIIFWISIIPVFSKTWTDVSLQTHCKVDIKK